MRERELAQFPLAVLFETHLSHHEGIDHFVASDCISSRFWTTPIRHGSRLETLEEPEGGSLGETFAVLTGEPNDVMAPLHDRMTTFLELREYEEYLVPSERPPPFATNPAAFYAECATRGGAPITNRQISLFESQ